MLWRCNVSLNGLYREIFAPVIQQAGLDPKEAECRLNWGMPETPDVEALLPMLANIARDRPDIIPAKSFRKILVDMGLALEMTLESEETKSPITK